ncbi:hypothetical protein ACMGDH_07775 [Sphingomonas sp. DT-207]|uniref:hypothetical protein n=1 Tax=Sphingomonas sp. DT-207 TaxID=3396167 RepID=UPI003F1DD5AC
MIGIFAATTMMLAAVQSAPAEAAPVTLEARETLERYAACVVDGSADKVSETLTKDFRSSEYRNAMDAIRSANAHCSRVLRKTGSRGATMRSSSLLVAGAMAELLLEREGSPLKTRLAKAAGGVQTTAFSPSDAMAICVVRSVPDDVSALFVTTLGSEEEAAAVGRLDPAVKACSAGRQYEVNPEGMRAMLATAAFRSVAAQSAQTSSR